jgi:hypothetical protein
MDTEELNEYFVELGDILGSNATESGDGDVYASSYLESLSNYISESESHRIMNKDLAEIENQIYDTIIFENYEKFKDLGGTE